MLKDFGENVRGSFYSEHRLKLKYIFQALLESAIGLRIKACGISCYFALICLIQSAAEQNYHPFAGISLADAALKWYSSDSNN